MPFDRIRVQHLRQHRACALHFRIAGPFAFAALLGMLGAVTLGAVPPRKGVAYRPTPDGGRACYIDGAFAYEMPKVPKGMYGATFGVDQTAVLADGPRDQRDWSAYLRSKGFRFERGASATFFEGPDHLVVVNTREQLALLMKWAGVSSEDR